MTRMKPEDRKELIIVAATKVAAVHGYTTMRREQVAEAAGCATGLVNKYFNTMKQLRRAVMRRAVVDQNLNIIAQGILIKDPQALKVSEDLKKRALASMIN